LLAPFEPPEARVFPLIGGLVAALMGGNICLLFLAFKFEAKLCRLWGCFLSRFVSFFKQFIPEPWAVYIAPKLPPWVLEAIFRDDVADEYAYDGGGKGCSPCEEITYCLFF